MSQFELTLAWGLFFWIVASSVVAAYIGNRCISIMIDNCEGLVATPKKVPANLFGSKNLSFFLKYKPKESDKSEFILAAQKWKKVQVVYYLQLGITFLLAVEFLGK